MLTRIRHTRLERIIRDATNEGNSEKVEEILDQLCNDYAYAVHQPHARNGGLIGLAAAAIALGPVGSSLSASVRADTSDTAAFRTCLVICQRLCLRF